MLDLVQLYNQDPTISQGTEKTTGAGLLISSWVSTRLFPIYYGTKTSTLSFNWRNLGESRDLTLLMLAEVISL